MSSLPIDMVLSRLAPFKLRENGRDRWRACCPAHGGSNPSALSVGIGNGGAVLLKCWHGCSAEEVAGALGLELGDLFPPHESHGAPLKRRALLSAQQCLDVIAFECLLTWTAAFNLANGHALTPEDLQRLAIAGSRIQALAAEVHT
jgi:hypothetical protein